MLLLKICVSSAFFIVFIIIIFVIKIIEYCPLEKMIKCTHLSFTCSHIAFSIGLAEIDIQL